MRKEILFIEIFSLVWIWFSPVHCMSLLLVFFFKKGLFGIHRVGNQPILNTVYAIFFQPWFIALILLWEYIIVKSHFNLLHWSFSSSKLSCNVVNFSTNFAYILWQYPKEPPHIDLIDSKGLDEQRQKELMTCIQDKACELSCYLMLVALCEVTIALLIQHNF